MNLLNCIYYLKGIFDRVTFLDEDEVKHIRCKIDQTIKQYQEDMKTLPGELKVCEGFKCNYPDWRL